MGDAFSCALVCDMCVKRGVKWYGCVATRVQRRVVDFVNVRVSSVSVPKSVTGLCRRRGTASVRVGPSCGYERKSSRGARKDAPLFTRHITDTDTLNCMAMELHHSPSPDDQMTLF